MNPVLAAALRAASSVATATPPPPAVQYRPSLLVQLAVRDLDRSIRFYTETLGFALTERRDDLQFAHVSCGLDMIASVVVASRELAFQSAPGRIERPALNRPRGRLSVPGSVSRGSVVRDPRGQPANSLTRRHR